jgi:hypothetical protein
VEAVIRKPNMVATLLRDDTNHISLLSLSIFSLLCYLTASHMYYSDGR